MSSPHVTDCLELVFTVELTELTPGWFPDRGWGGGGGGGSWPGVGRGRKGCWSRTKGCGGGREEVGLLTRRGVVVGVGGGVLGEVVLHLLLGREAEQGERDVGCDIC